MYIAKAGNGRSVDDNAALKGSLGEEQARLGQAKTNLLVQLAIVERLRGNPDAALRFSIYAARAAQRGQPHERYHRHRGGAGEVLGTDAGAVCDWCGSCVEY